MNSKEYAAYVATVEAFYERNGIHSLNAVTDENGESDEGSFSRSGCDCCGTRLGGNRTRCEAFVEATKEVITFSEVCDDCIYFSAYGQLPDSDMPEKE